MTGRKRMKMIPHPLLDAVKKHLGVETDRELCKLVKIQYSATAKLRHGVHNVSPELILKLHKATGWTIERIEFLCVDREKMLDVAKKHIAEKKEKENAGN